MAKKKEEIVLDVIEGVEGPCVVINGYRFFGPKPWGGGGLIHTLKTDKEDFIKSLGHIGIAVREVGT